MGSGGGGADGDRGGSGGDTEVRSRASDTANSAPAAVNAPPAPPAASTTPPTAGPAALLSRSDRPRMPWTRASCSRVVIRGGNAPTAGMNTASTTPKRRASGISSRMSGAADTSTAAVSRITRQRVASLTAATRRGPNRSATTPPASMNTARGSAPAATARPAWDGPAARAADHDRARKQTTSPVTEAVCAASQRNTLPSRYAGRATAVSTSRTVMSRRPAARPHRARGTPAPAP
ncbi:hypothetical protein CF54_18105 [Streptomyces sp. Tu 6176]|nr:hypothetical protein CF54_18105 [Streptomyces sp. Tu 6176]